MKKVTSTNPKLPSSQAPAHQVLADLQKDARSRQTARAGGQRADQILISSVMV